MFRSARGSSSRRSPLLQELILGQLATVGGAFLINLLSARAMGPEGRGEIALILQLSYIVGALLPLGRDRAVLQADLTQVPPDQVRSGIAGLVRTPAIILLASCVVFAVWRHLLDGSTLMAVGFLLLLIGNLASRFFRSTAIVEGRGRAYVVATVLGQVGLVLGGGSLLVVGIAEVTPWLLAYGASLALPFLVLAARRRRNGRQGQVREEVVLPDLGRTRALGLGFLPSEVMEMAMTKADKLLLPILGSYTIMGYYTVAVSLVDFSLMPFWQYVDSRIPFWARLHREGRLRIGSLMLRPVLGALGMVTVVALVSHAAIPILFGEAYTPAQSVIPWLALATFCHAVSLLLVGVATAVGSARAMIWMHVVGIVVNLTLLVALIPGLGATGAAIAQAAGFSASAAVGAVFVRAAARKSARGGGS